MAGEIKLINNEAYREWAITREYEIPHQVSYICDATFGRGIVMVKNIFTEDIKSLENFRIEKEQKVFDNLVPVEEAERCDWNDL